MSTYPTYPGGIGKTGGLGEKLYNWLIRLPVIGDIVMQIFRRRDWLTKLTETADERTLRYYADFGEGELREAALRGLEQRFPATYHETVATTDPFAELRRDPSQAIGSSIRRAMTNPVVTELSEVVGASVYDSVMAMAIGGGEKLSPDMQERIRRFLGTTLMLTTVPKVAGTIAEVSSLGAIKTLGDVFRDAYFNLGLGFVTWQMTSPLIDAGIGQELRRQSNYIFRPTRFGWSELRDLYTMGLIDYNTLRQRLAELGYRDDDINAMVELAYKPLSEGTLIGMWLNNIIDDATCAQGLRTLGYAAVDIERIMRYNRQQKLDSQKDVLLSTARKAFKDGLIGETRLREILTGLNWSAEAIDLEIAVLKLDAQETERSLTTSELKAAFLSNVITEVEASNALLASGMRSDEIPILIETWKRSRVPDVLRVNKQTILQALARGVLSESEARGKLAEIGYPPADVDLIIRTSLAEGLQTRPKVSVGLLIEAARDNVISIPQLKDRLRVLGYEDFDVELIAAVASGRREIPLTDKDVIDAFIASVIDRVTAGQKLIALGVSPATAELRLDTAEKERELRKPKVGLALLMGLAANGLLTPDELTNLLRAREFSDIDINLIKAAAYYQPPTPLSQGTVVNAYKAGVLNRDEALDKLFILNFTPEDAQTILLTAEKEMTVTQARPSVTTYVAATRDGILKPEELRRKLQALGMKEDDIALFIELATFTPAEPAKKLTKAEVLQAYEKFMFNRVDALRRLEMLGYAIEDADTLIRMVRRDPQDSEVHTLYQAGILTTEQAAIALSALGYTDEQIEYYFEHYGKPTV